MKWLLRRNDCRPVHPDENGNSLHVVGANSLEVQGCNTATQACGLAELQWASFVHCPDTSIVQQGNGTDLPTQCGASRRRECRASPDLVQSECHSCPRLVNLGQLPPATLSSSSSFISYLNVAFTIIPPQISNGVCLHHLCLHSSYVSYNRGNQPLKSAGLDEAALCSSLLSYNLALSSGLMST